MNALFVVAVPEQVAFMPLNHLLGGIDFIHQFSIDQRCIRVVVIGAVTLRLCLQGIQAAVQVTQIELRDAGLCLEQLDAAIAMQFDLFHGKVGRQ